MKPIIVALDFNSFEQSKKIVDLLKNEHKWFKVGLEAFYSHGQKILSYLKQNDLNVFLDLKLHDIPTTMKKSALALTQNYFPDILNLHALSGVQAMKQTKEALIQTNTKLIGVTILTSHDQDTLNLELGIKGSVQNAVSHLKNQVLKSELHGVVCSAHEISLFKPELENFLVITPGIRFKAQAHDQKRIMTPKEAFNKGATHIVMGREITQADDPLKVLNQVKESLYV